MWLSLQFSLHSALFVDFGNLSRSPISQFDMSDPSARRAQGHKNTLRRLWTPDLQDQDQDHSVQD